MTLTDIITSLVLTEDQSAAITEWVATRESELAAEKREAVQTAVAAEIARFSEIQTRDQASKAAEIQTATAAANQARESAESDLAAAREEIARLTAPPPITARLAELNAAFKSAVPEEMRGAFGIPFATVRILLQAGETDLAVATVRAIAVPPEMEDAKAAILALLTP